MPAPKGNKYAKGNKGGNPGTGKLHFVANQVNKYQKLWWDNWKEMIESVDRQERIDAMREFNKLQCKMIPQQLGGDENNPFRHVFEWKQK